MDLFTLLQDHAAVFLLMLTRCSGIFLIAPFFGSLNIPIMVRAATAFMFAVVLFPVVDGLGPVDAPTSVLMYTVAVLKELNASFGIPASLSEAGVTKDKFDAMADDAMKSGNIAVNPRATKKSDVLDLYEKAF